MDKALKLTLLGIVGAISSGVAIISFYRATEPVPDPARLTLDLFKPPSLSPQEMLELKTRLTRDSANYLKQLVKVYEIRLGNLPTDLESIVACTNQPPGCDSESVRRAKLDAWGNEFTLHVEGSEVTIRSGAAEPLTDKDDIELKFSP